MAVSVDGMPFGAIALEDGGSGGAGGGGGGSWSVISRGNLGGGGIGGGRFLLRITLRVSGFKGNAIQNAHHCLQAGMPTLYVPF